ncbi:MAG: hypothetical protein GX568_10160 [Candidatus Gastranaerophilales bacterium]|nr:hypothetical protein [Candidatus Gastranaerophilales bacterium]
MLAKLLCIVTVCNLYLGWEVELPRKDLILLESGEKVEGHIITITNGIIEIKTDGGKKRITRDVNLHSPRDIVEIGIIRNKRHAGTVEYFADHIKITTSSGDIEFDRALVRKIIISHESALPPLNL